MEDLLREAIENSPGDESLPAMLIGFLLRCRMLPEAEFILREWEEEGRDWLCLDSLVAEVELEKRRRASPGYAGTEPVAVEAVQPECPESAVLTGARGPVHVRVRVGTDGRVQEVAIVESCGSRALEAAAVEAARKWVFSPARGQDGAPVVSEVVLRFEFDCR
ncbi:MAG: hypothetical protein DRN14_07205 [Thermoplasmata archaeon]|nr:MAG: hypothetical protein DRN14_07205 [Thermoplasmata archaeon]